jgi:hypothetical protein
VKPVKQQTNSPPKQSPPKQELVASTPQRLLAATSDEALDRHLAEWGGVGGRLFAFNGSTGIHRTLDDGVEVPSGTQFVAFLHETRKGYIRFNNGAPPDVHMVRIDENDDIDRAALGDNDKVKWPVGLNGEREDPFKEQFAIPMARDDEGGERFIYVARGVVAMNSVGYLLGSWRHHAKRAEGLIPVVSVENGTYPNKRFGGRKPKPVLRILRWVTKTGAPPPSSEPKQAIEKPSLSKDLNDSIGF